MKGFFSSFRNAMLSILCAIVVLAAAGICIVYVTGAAGKELMDRNAALEYALADAGVSVSDITITRQKLYQENGKSYYEIGFFTDSYEYEYEIDAATGAVLGMDIEALFNKPMASAGDIGGNAAENTPPESGLPGNSDPRNDSQPDNEPPDAQQSGSQPPDNGQPDAQENPAAQEAAQPQASGTDGRIGVDAAKDKALSDAGLKASEVTFTKSKLDMDDGIYVYDIEFYTSDAEYEYEINAVTGAIVDKSMEMLQSRASSGTTGTSGNADAYIGTDRAKEIAVQDAGVALSDAVFTKSKLDTDDGIYVYDIEFYTSDAEYEYEINAATGAIVDKSMEKLQSRASSGTTGTSGNAVSYIGADRAKEIAAGNAGFDVSEVVFDKVKLEKEHNGSQYEIEFYVDGVEYEYCIDPFTGEILEFDCEYDGHGHSYAHHGCHCH